MKVATEVKDINNEEKPVYTKADKKSGKRIGYNYIIVKSLKESKKNDVVKCLYIKSLTNFGICVIKEGTYGDSKDPHGRDIKDRLLWQEELHRTLQDKVRMPRLLGSFEENGNFYLVLERIRGKPMLTACMENRRDLREGLIAGNKLGLTFLDYIIQLINLLETLHQQQVVHRDVTTSNFIITPGNKVTVIDMELSYSLQSHYPSPPFQLGTYGFMSPEQEATQTPTFDQDVYSVAAIILQIWSGISPSKLTNAPIEELAQRVFFLIPDKAFADIIIRCLHPVAENRPTLEKLREVVIAYKDDLGKKTTRIFNSKKKYSNYEITETIQRAIGTLASPLLADKETGWFSENIGVDQNPDKRKINKSWYTSFHKGASGVIYTLSKANKMGFNVDASKPYIEMGIRLIETKYISRLAESKTGLLFGASGIAATLATSISEGLVEPQVEYFDWINRMLEKENDALNFQNGISGQGIANWICLPFLHPATVKERLAGYVSRLLENQKKDGSWLASENEKKKKTPIDFAMGVPGIVYFMINYASYYKHQESLKSAEKGLQWLIKKAVREKQFIRWDRRSNKEASPWWYNGSAGIALTFMKAYSLFGDEKYKEFAMGALRNNKMEIIDNNLSQCYGLSGLGEVYLEAYRIFKDEEWLMRAQWITQVLMQLKIENSAHGPYWLTDHERQPVADFGIGNSGIIHFLLRYTFPGEVEFPLST